MNAHSKAAVSKPAASKDPTDITTPEDKIPLPKPVPIYVTYLTARPDGTGIAFHDDPYGLDAGVRLATAD